jgi:hypothetical protein
LRVRFRASVGAALAGLVWLVLVQLCPQRLYTCSHSPPQQQRGAAGGAAVPTPTPLHPQPCEPTDDSLTISFSNSQRADHSGGGYLAERMPANSNPKLITARLAAAVAKQWNSKQQAVHVQEVHVANLDQLQATMAEHIRQLSMQHTRDLRRIESRLPAPPEPPS